MRIEIRHIVVASVVCLALAVTLGGIDPSFIRAAGRAPEVTPMDESSLVNPGGKPTLLAIFSIG